MSMKKQKSHVSGRKVSVPTKSVVVYERYYFTLIEFLVVIAIISILASMLLPAISKAREKAYGISCRSNMKTTGSSFMMYTADNAGYMPLNRYAPYGSTLIWWI